MNWIKEIASNKIAIGAFSVLILVVVIYILFRKDKSGTAKTLKTVGNEIADRSKSQTPSFTDSNYSSFADQIYEGMRYSWASDDYDAAEKILKKMENDLDVLKLIDAYGSRKEMYFGILPDGPAKTLTVQVSDDFSDARINRVNSDYQSKGIDFRF